MKRQSRWIKAAILAVVGSLLASTSTLAAEFVPEEVFAGRSTGQGALKLPFKEPQPFTVQSIGAKRSDGTFELDQTVQFGRDPARLRSWVMRRIGPNTYTATLTDAAGPVVAHIEGPRMTLRYPLKKWGLVMHQTLDLADDGRTVKNCGHIKLLGIPIGRLHETIRLE